MSIDPSIPLQIQAPRINSPFETLAGMQKIQLQQQELQGNQALEEERRRKNADQAALNAIVQKHAAAGAVDPDAVVLELQQTGHGAIAQTLSEQINKAKMDAATQYKSTLENQRNALSLGGSLLNGVRDENSYQAVRPKLLELAKSIHPDLAQTIPNAYDPAAVAAIQSSALSAKEVLDQHNTAATAAQKALELERAKEKDAPAIEKAWTESAGTMLATATSDQEWQAYRAMLTPTVPAAVLQKFGETFSPAAVAQAKALVMGPTKQAELEQGARSPAYKEWTDYKNAGGTLDFNAYQTMDANRKTPRPPLTDVAQQAAAVDTAARNILANPRDLTSIRNITSLRGDQRMLLFNKLKELDPTFNVGSIDRKIKFLDEYENPVGRAAINRGSMNNILMHAADLEDVNQQYQRTDTRVLNRPIAAIKAQGGTQWEQFQVPLTVLKDEIANYFAGGYAPSPDDKKQWDKIVNDTATPRQVEDFAKGLIHVGLRRADTHNEGFKTVMGYDDPNLITPAAVQAAVHLGLGDAVKKYGSGGQVFGAAPAPSAAVPPAPPGAPPAGATMTIRNKTTGKKATGPRGPVPAGYEEVVGQ